MKIGIQTLVKARGAWQSFRSNHPNLLPFLRDISRKGLKEDVQVEILVHFPDGEEKNCGIRLKQSDLAFIDVLNEML